MRWWLALCLLWPSLPGLAAPTDPFPKIARAYLVARDGAVLWARQPAQRLAPASLTKLMTVLLVLERLDRGEISLDDTVAVSKTAASSPGSTALLDAGASYRVEDLLRSAIVASGNDSATALAEHLAGSEQVVRLVLENDLLRPEGVLIFEHSKKMDFSAYPEFWQQRSYGSVQFSFFRKP